MSISRLDAHCSYPHNIFTQRQSHEKGSISILGDGVDIQRFRFRDFATLQQISSYCNKRSLTEKRHCTCTLGHNWQKVGLAFQSIQWPADTSLWGRPNRLRGPPAYAGKKWKRPVEK